MGRNQGVAPPARITVGKVAAALWQRRGFRRGAAAVAVGAIGVGALAHGLAGPGASADGDEVLVGRIWLDHVPTKPNEHAEWFVVIEQSAGEGQGVFSRASQFEGAFSVFGWKAPSRGELVIEMLQDKTRHTVKYKAEKCAKDGFDFCLELSGAPKGVQRYGSKRGWELGGDADPARLREEIERRAARELR